MPKRWCLRQVLVLVIVTASLPARGEEPAAPRQSEARRSFEGARFGLFVHWGVSSLVGKGEWLMEQDRMPISEYARRPPRFNPPGFDAERWVEAARQGGQKYLA